MIKTLITYALVSAFTLGSANNPVNRQNEELLIVIPTEKRPVAAVTSKRSFYKRVEKEFLNFKLLGRCNTNIHNSLEDALASYTGPKVGITSLRRHWGNKSAHECGKAVDMEFSHELIDYLVSEAGQQWLEAHNLMFYIEDVPGSRLLAPYKADSMYSKYVFENPNATGEHVHIQIRR